MSAAVGKVVVGVDGSPESKAALAWAVAEARRRRVGVHVVHAWHPPSLYGLEVSPFAAPAVEEALREVGKRILDEAIEQVVGTATDVPIRRAVVDEQAATALVDAAGSDGLLVVGSRGRGGFIGLLLGSVSQQSAELARCPVVVVRGQPHAAKRIVVGVDGSEHARAALRWAADEARLRDSALCVVYAWEPLHYQPAFGVAIPYPIAAAEAEAATFVKRVAAEVHGERGSTHVDAVALRGSPAHVLVEEARNAELLVVGSHGHGALAGVLLGSVSRKCMHHAPCPLAIVR